MAAIATKPRLAVKIPAAPRLGIPQVARLSSVADRSTELSKEVLESLEAGERSAIEAVGQFVVAIEDGLPQEVASTSDAAKKVTQAGVELADRLVHAQHEFLRSVIDSTAKSLRVRDGAGPAPQRPLAEL